jgi:hypothetical protein
MKGQWLMGVEKVQAEAVTHPLTTTRSVLPSRVSAIMFMVGSSMTEQFVEIVAVSEGCRGTWGVGWEHM